MMQYMPNLGEVPDAQAQKDAIHIAVYPAVATATLRPGCWVAFAPADGPGYMRNVPRTDAVGLVDPYRVGDIPPHGEFWCLMIPNTVTTLRHEWDHPALAFQRDLRVPRAWATIEAIAGRLEMTGRDLVHAAAAYESDRWDVTQAPTWAHVGDMDIDWSAFWEAVDVLRGAGVVKAAERGAPVTGQCGC